MIGPSRWAWRVSRIIAFGIFVLGSAAQAGTNEPFDLPSVAAPEGPLWVTWRRLQSEIQSEKSIISRCRTEPESCTSSAALRFIAIVDGSQQFEDLVRIKHINRAVNLSIRPLTATAESRIDPRWTSPLAALASGAGDCKQYSLLKYAMLSDAGVAPEDLRLLIVFIKSSHESHAVLAVRYATRWHILDNRSLAVVDSRELHDYLPLYALDYRGVGQFVHKLDPKIAGEPCSGASIN